MDQPNPACQKCNSEFPYQDGMLWICPECNFEWSTHSNEESVIEGKTAISDANGNILNDGDSVTVIKDLKIKGSSSSIKVGTKVKNIRLILDSNDGHDIACKIEGFGAMNLKSQFVKKI